MSTNRRFNIAGAYVLMMAFSAIAMAAPAIVYERPMTDEEKNAPRIGYQDYLVKKSITLADHQKMYQATPPPQYIIKVELLDEVPGIDGRHLRLYSIREDYLRNLDAIGRAIEDEKWLEPRRKSLPLKVDEIVYQVTETQMKCRGPKWQRHYFPQMNRWVDFYQTIESKVGKQRIGIQVEDISPYPVTPHELLGKVLEWEGDSLLKFSGRESIIGHIYAGAGKATDGKEPAVGAVWISGDHHLVRVFGTGISLDELLALVGKQYPSSLKATEQLDPLKWHRQEIQLRIESLEKAVASEETAPAEYRYLAMQVLDMVRPVALTDFLYEEKISRDEARELHKGLEQWWKAHRDNARWLTQRLPYSGEFQVLDANGRYYNPMLEAEHFKKMAAEETEQKKIEAMKIPPTGGCG